MKDLIADFIGDIEEDMGEKATKIVDQFKNPKFTQGTQSEQNRKLHQQETREERLERLKKQRNNQSKNQPKKAIPKETVTKQVKEDVFKQELYTVASTEIERLREGIILSEVLGAPVSKRNRRNRMGRV